MKFDDWLKEQGDDVRTMIAERFANLESALRAERADHKTAAQKAKELEEQVREATAKLDGGVLLSKDDGALFETYKTLGTPDDLKAGLDERETLRGQLDETRREAVLRDVAEAAGYRLPVLKDRDKAAGGLEYEVKEVEENRQKARKVFVRDGDKSVALADYAKANWADYLPALQPEAPAPSLGTPRREPTRAPAATPPAPEKRQRLTL